MTSAEIEKSQPKASVWFSLKRLISVPNVLGVVANLVIFLKILEALLKRDFSGIVGKATEYYTRLETDLIGVITRLLPAPWLKDFLALNLDTILIVSILFFMSLASATALLKVVGARDGNANKTIDTLIIIFFVTFGSSLLLLLNAARGCTQTGACDILTHGRIVLSLPLTQVYAVGAIFLASNIIGTPLIFAINRIRVDIGMMLKTYASIAIQLLIFGGVVLVSLIIAGFS